MLVMVLSAAGTGLRAQNVPAQMPDAELRAQAETLRKQSQWPEALATYRELVRRHPENAEDRFWIARITGWRGDLAASQELLLALRQEKPRDYEVRIALADTRAWLKNYSAAMAELESLDRDFPNNAEIMVRIGRLHRWMNRNREARHSFEQVLKIEANQAEAKEGLQQLKLAEMSWELRVDYGGEKNSFAPASHLGTVSLSNRSHEKLRWAAELTIQHRFGETDYRLGTEMSSRLKSGTYLRWAAFAAPQATVIARQGYSAHVVQRLGSHLAVDTGYAFLAFQHARSQQLSAQLDYYANARWSFTGRYGYALSSYTGISGLTGNHSAGLAMHYQHHEADALSFSYSDGAEAFSLTTADKIGMFRANTIGAGWQHFLTPRTGFAVFWGYQFRSSGARQQFYSLGLIRRW